MKIYLLTVHLFNDDAFISVCKDSAFKKDDNISFSITTWFGEPDWHKIMQAIAFFDAQYVVISPRFDNADDFTSEPKEN